MAYEPKIGDIVKLIAQRPVKRLFGRQSTPQFGGPPVGSRGIVREATVPLRSATDDHADLVGVEWDNYGNGHDLNGLAQDHNAGFRVPIESLELVRRPRA